MIGKTLAHYEIIEPLGAGGMGEVYRARDTKLSREVAVKVLPPDLSADAERLARFRREAKVLASLNHPNIAGIFGLEESEGRSFLVMELAEGEDLAVTLARGPVPTDRTMEIARQIASGLEEAHEKGIVHRDLKPANVKIAPGDRVKILDFGLARAYADEKDDPQDLERSPTITAAMTQAGTILGTAAYMSPEQARGVNVDRRADIWALGVLVWEMLTGRRLFAGETVSDTLAMVMRDPVELDDLPARTPPSLRWLLARCLERDPQQRLRDVGEARWVLAGGSVAAPAATLEAPGAGGLPRWMGLILLVLLAGVAAVAFWAGRRTAPPVAVPGRTTLTRFALTTPEELQFLDDAPRLSPDGRRVAYATESGLWLHDLGDLTPNRLNIEAELPRAPFWAPDGEQLGYFSISGSQSALWRYELGAGRNQLVSRLDGGLVGGVGASWGADGMIRFSQGGTGVLAVSWRGGDPEEVIPTGEGVQDLHEPHTLPRGRGILLVEHRLGSAGGGNRIVVRHGGRRSELLTSPRHRIWNPVYSPTGHVLYHRTGDNAGIWALPVSLDPLQVTGDPVLVEPEASLPHVSANGDLVYVEHNDAGGQVLVWVDPATGEFEHFGDSYFDLQSPSISENGRRLIVSASQGSDGELWLFDLVEGTRQQVESTPSTELDLDWIDDDEIVFTLAGIDSIYTQNVIAGTPPRWVATGDRPSAVPGTRDVIFRGIGPGPEGEPGFYRTSVDDPDAVEPVLLGDHLLDAAVDPSNRLMATIRRDPSGDRVMITRYPGASGSWAVPSNAAAWICWGFDGRLYWREGPRQVVAVSVELASTGIRIGERQLVSQLVGMKSWGSGSFDVHPDGRVVLVQIDRDADEERRIVVVRNPQALLTGGQ